MTQETLGTSTNLRERSVAGMLGVGKVDEGEVKESKSKMPLIFKLKWFGTRKFSSDHLQPRVWKQLKIVA
jgi:hypothetical protein